jgi:hypothetical protein
MRETEKADDWREREREREREMENNLKNKEQRSACAMERKSSKRERERGREREGRESRGLSQKNDDCVVRPPYTFSNYLLIARFVF